MITVQEEKHESRSRDRKRHRIRLTIGTLVIRLTLDEAYRLGTQLLWLVLHPSLRKLADKSSFLPSWELRTPLKREQVER